MTPNRLAIMVLLLAACGGQPAGPYSSPPPPPPPSGGLPPLAGAVSMGTSSDGYGGTLPTYLPPSITIRREGTVTWTNNTGIAHSVTFSAVAGAPASIPAPATGANQRSFPTAGEFDYHCTVHPGMVGRVVVE